MALLTLSSWMFCLSMVDLGEGEVPVQPDDSVILAAGDTPTKFTDKYGTRNF